MTDMLRGKLPPMYRHLLPPNFDRPAVEEPRSTCDDCAMCDKGNIPEGVDAVYFRPDLKCCTYHPYLPNFHVGALLADTRPEFDEGRKRVRARIATRIAIYPHGVGPPPKYHMLYEASKNATFGRAPSMRCPYLSDEGRCSVWPWREAVCSTFYCKYSGGQRGVAFWRALKQYMAFAEGTLAAWAMREVSTSLKHPGPPNGRLTLEDIEDQAPRKELYESWWADWIGREEAVYLGAHEAVKKLSREDYSKLVDLKPKGKELLTTMTVRYNELMTAKTPDHLVLNKRLRVIPSAKGPVVTPPYNPFDSFCLDPDLFEVLKQLDGEKTVDENRARLRDEQEIDFDPELLRELATHTILVRPDAPVPTPAGGNFKKR